MPDLPRAVLSREIGDRLSGRRLVSGVFLTYRFDPGFFEQEVLPVFFDVSFSHATVSTTGRQSYSRMRHCASSPLVRQQR